MVEAIVNRRAFGLGVAAVCTLAVYPEAHAAPAPARVDPPIPDPLVEFDGKAHLNPKVLPSGIVVATGVVRPPKDCKILHVQVKWQKTGTTNVSRIQNAILDMSVDPPTWKIQIENVETGEYWFDTNVMYKTPDGTEMREDSFDKRRVYVAAAPK